MTVAISGDFGKPRPTLVIQSDRFEGTGTLTVLLISSSLVDAPLIRLTVQPNPQSNLRKARQVIVDKAMTIKRDTLGDPFGHLDDETMLSVTRSLAVVLGIV